LSAAADLPFAALLAFAVTMMGAALYVLTAAGHFPRSHRLEHMRSGLGAATLWGTMPITALAVFGASMVAWRDIPIAWAVIAGSLSVLVAPLVLQWFSDAIVDGIGGLIGFALLALVASGAATVLST